MLGPEGSFSVLRAALSQQPAKQWGLQSDNHMELNSANNLNELESGSFPEPLDENLAQPTPWFQTCETQKPSQAYPNI